MRDRSRTAVVFGKGPVAVSAVELLQEQSYQVLFVVPSSAEVSGQLALGDWAASRDIEVRRPDKLDDLVFEKVDLGISAFFDRIFRQRHIDKFEMLVNLHNSLLPRYRGVRPINWALKNGETTHGVTLHRITPGIDEGPILAQESFPIDPDIDEVRDVYGRCLDAAQTLLARSLPAIWDLPAVAQNPDSATYHDSSDDDGLGDRRYWTRGDATLN